MIPMEIGRSVNMWTTQSFNILTPQVHTGLKQINMPTVNEYKKRLQDHILTKTLEMENYKIYRFARPDSGMYAQIWIVYRDALIVMGDCYDAIYRWHGPTLTLKFLAGCNLGYFSSKCVADKDGSEQSVYDSDDGENLMKEIACQHIFEANWEALEDLSDEEWNALKLEDKFELVKPIIMNELGVDEFDVDGMFYHDREGDAFDFMNNPENEFMFGQDAWEHKLQKLTATPMMHLAGIQVAVEKFEDIL